MKECFARPRVVLLTTDMGRGGAARVFSQHARDFKQFSCVDQAVFGHFGASFYEYDTGLTVLDDYKSFFSRFGRLGRFLNRVLGLRKLVNSRNIDVVISHLEGASIVNVASRSAAKKIAVVHGSTLIAQNRRGFFGRLIWAQILGYVLNSADATVAVSDSLAAELAQLYAVRNVVAIKNYIDAQLIVTKSKEKLSSLNETIAKNPRFKLVTHGRISAEKNLSAQIYILSRLKNHGLNVSLVLVGDGPELENLELLCRKLGLTFLDLRRHSETNTQEWDVCVAGYIKNPFAILSACEIFLLTSLYEGYPLSLCEAMICGLPVIASDCPTGPREIIAPGSPIPAQVGKAQLTGAHGLLLPTPIDEHAIKVWVSELETAVLDPARYEDLRERARFGAQYLTEHRGLASWQELVLSQSGLNH